MQAPIGPACSWELVAEVSRAGGLGTLAASWTGLGTLRDEIERIKAATSGPFCVNLVLAFDQRERLALALGLGVPAVSFSWGVDATLIGRVRAAGATALVQIGNVPDAKQAANAGAAVVIAQGIDAGGHVEGTTSLPTLIRELRTTLEIPIVAAGGIADSATAARAFAAGADAVACGTAFLGASEANVHPEYRARLFAANASDTVLTELFDVGWPNAPHRVIRNSTLAAWEAARRPPPGRRPGEGDVIARRDGGSIVRYSDAQPTRETEGSIEAMAMYAGRSVGHVTRIRPAREILASIAPD